MRIRFIKEGDSKAYTRYDFYSENIYASIGKEMDSRASAIALSCLRRSVVQGNADAIQEMQKLGKRSPTSFGIPTKKCILNGECLNEPKITANTVIFTTIKIGCK